MSSKNQLIQVPWPRRLNTDRPAPLLTPEETPVLRNIMPRLLPHEVRPRNPVRYLTATYPGTTGTYWGFMQATTSGAYYTASNQALMPYHAIVQPDGGGVFVFVANPIRNFNSTNATALQTPYESRAKVAAAGTDYWLRGTGLGGLGQTGAFGVGLPGSSTIDGSKWDVVSTNNTQAFGAPVYYDSCVFWCAAADSYPNSFNSKYCDTTTTTDRKVVTKEAYVCVGGAGYTQFNPFTSVTTTLTIANGSTKGTIPVSALVTTHAGWIITLTGSPTVNGMPQPQYQYQYRIKSVDSTTAITLDRPYGLGESATNCPALATCSIKVEPWAPLQNSIPGATTLALFNDRVFSARGTVSQTLATGAPQEYPTPVGEYGGYYGNAIFWSKPGNWNRWPDQNFAIVDQDGNDPITGLYSLGDKLIIFKTNKIFAMSGYDEDSFQIDKVTDVVGCPYPNGMVSFEGVLYFANMEGVWSYDGTNLRNISSPAGGQGISQMWNSRAWYRANAWGPAPSDSFWPTMAVTPDAHLLVVVNPDFASGTNVSGVLTWEDNFVYDIRNDAWGEWGVEDISGGKTYNPVRVVTQHTTGKVYGIHRSWISDLTDMFNPSFGGQNVTWVTRTDSRPALVDNLVANPSVSQLTFTCNIESWFQPGPGNTVRVRECQVDHGALYLASTWPANTPSDKPVWTFKIATDPKLQLGSTQHTVYARVESSITYDATDIVNNNRLFSDRFPETFQTEAQAVRVAFTGTVQTPADNLSVPRYSGWSLYSLKFTVDTTRQMGVDNTAYTNSF